MTQGTRATLRRFFAAGVSVITGALVLGIASPAHAVTAEQLLELLLKKGVITEEEYKVLSEKKEPEKPSGQAESKPAAKPEAAAKEQPKPAPGNEVSGTFKDGITWESADKQNSIALKGRIELDSRNFGGPDAANADTFDVRRAYLGAEGKFWENYEFRVRANFSTLNGPNTTVCTQVGPTSPTDPTPRCTQTASVANSSNTNLDEAWLNVNWWRGAQFKFGQFKMPMSLEQLTADIYTDFMERSMGDVITPNKERGVQVHGVPVAGVTYALALSNGQGINANDTVNSVDNKDILGRATVNIAELIGQKNAVYHLGGSYSTGTQPASAAPSTRTEGRGITFFVPSAFTGDEVDRTRYGLEGVIAFGPAKFQVEQLNANFKGRSSLGVNYDKDIRSYYGSLTWLVTGERYADSYRNGVWGRIRPKSNFSPKGGGLGAWELGLRYSKFDASDFETSTAALVGTGVKPSTSANTAKAWTLGVKWIVNPNTRFLLNYIRTKFDSPVTVTNSGNTAVVDDERALNFRAQFDF